MWKKNPLEGPGARERLLLFAGCALSGGLADFIFCGVFKIIWIAIYGTAYLAFASVLIDRLHTTKFSEFAHFAAASLVIGATLVHLVLTGHSRTLAYTMELSNRDPLTFVSADWPDYVVVVSPGVTRKLTELNATAASIVISEILDYGCIREFHTESIADVDVRFDPAATWTWKRNKASPSVPIGPGQEDQVLPWCRLKFYRGAK